MTTKLAILDDYQGVKATITISSDAPERIVGIDLLTGREQELAFSVDGDRLIVHDLIVKDYPLLLRLEY